jgi:hypothetical protein
VAADPRRFPGLLLIHIILIVVCLAVACATVALRSIDESRAAVATPPHARPTPINDTAPTARPLVAPPSTPVSLDAALAAEGYDLPEHSDVYAVRIVDGAGGRVYQQYQAGGGALVDDFWPASSIKVLAALGALDYARSLGYTGAATVTFNGDGEEESRSLRSIYEPAIRDSSNYDYDLLVRIAGVDWLNSRFLTAQNGFPLTSITEPYDGTDLHESPPMILEEGDRRTYVPARQTRLKPKCQAGNCSNLFEMAESVRRIVLNDDLPPEQRFDLDHGDIEDLKQALLDADGFFPPAVSEVLGDDVRIYDKPGDVSDLDCLDVALVETDAGRRYLLAATVPHASGGCDALVELAAEVLRLLV